MHKTPLSAKRHRLALLTGALATAIALSGCAAGAPASPSPTADRHADARRAANEHCVASGGEIQLRQPTYGTNNAPQTWVPLGDPVEVCRFRTGEGSTATAIYVDPVTLNSSRPTLAALAYLAKATVPLVAPANPASQHCIDLGGARNYGSGPAGGGLVLKDDPIDVVDVCTFADGSFIDEWGIAYYSSGAIRGADLAPKFRFDAASAPSIFPSNAPATPQR